MRKIAIFVEGQGEQIFVRNLLQILSAKKAISFECKKLLFDHNEGVAPFPQFNPNAEFHFYILDTGSDSKVLSAIKERSKGLVEVGYEKIIGLRDLYCKEYDELSPSKISNQTSQRIIDETTKNVNKLEFGSIVDVHFTIMELEAWFIGFYRMFERLNSKLTVKLIEDKLGYNLAEIDPQTEFFKPSNKVKEILKLASLNYDKSKDIVEKIVGNIKVEDYEKAIEDGKINSFKVFYELILG